MSLKQIAFLSLLSVAILCGVYFASTSLASPTCQSGTNCAAINVEPNTWNVTIGSSTVTSSARLYLVPMASTHTAITADGIIKVRVGGITYPDGNTQTVAFTGSGMTPAANISQGAFTNGGAGGNFAFQSGLAIGTTTYATLPQTLSVYGGGYFSGNVGIGTTNPGTKLHLRGTQGNLVVNTESVTNSIAIEAFNDGNTVKYPILLNPWGGNVGIGVTSPSGKLEIGGTEAADEPRLIFAASDASDRFTIKTDLDAITSNDFLGFRSVGVDNILVLKGNGNVGIGTTTPAYKLDVVGQINSSGGLCIAGDCKTSWSQVGGSSQWTNTTGGIYYLGNVGIGTSAVSYPLFVSTSTDTLFAIQRTGASSPTIFKQGTDAGFVINNGGSDILTIKSGNVGIGTTPAAGLDIAKGATNDLALALRSSGLGWGSGMQFINTAANARNYGIYAGSDGKWHFTDVTGSVDRLVVDSAGNVGIGTTGPGEKLEVAGNVKITGSRIKSSAGYGIVQTDATDWLRINPDSNYPAIALYNPVAIGTGGLAIGEWSQQSSGVLKVTQSAYLATGGGNVGIGTTNSYDRLHVYGGGLRISNGAFGANGFVFEQNGATGHLNIRYKNPTSTSAEVMTLGYDGKVGIGTTTPTAVLEIQKAATANLFKVGDGTNYMTWYGNGYNDINSYGAALRLYASTNGIQFRTGSVDPAVVILNGGNVGIGVSGPTYKLDVVSGGGTTARFGTASSDTVTVGNGAGKINVGTVDPIYTINGKKYATYGPESIGIKISHSDLIKLIRNGKYSEAKLDFKNAKEGSDLWLFSKTTNLIKNFNKLSIQLTPSFIGKVWYSKDKENMAVKIYAIPDLEENNDLEVTYTLTAPRFDADSWGNYSNDDVDGFIIND